LADHFRNYFYPRWLEENWFGVEREYLQNPVEFDLAVNDGAGFMLERVESVSSTSLVGL